MSVTRFWPAVTGLDQTRALLVGGSIDPAVEVPSDLFCLDGCGGQCTSPPCLVKEPGFAAGSGRAGTASVQVPCSGQTRGPAYVIGGIQRKGTTDFTIFDDIFCIDPDHPETMTHVGHLAVPRTLATAVLVRGPHGQRIFVAGGLNKVVLDSGELVPVPSSCGCPPADSLGPNVAAPGQITQVKLKAARYLHTAVELPDGSMLLTGGSIGARSAERFNPAF
jgi:hypothetical protein